MYKIGNYTLDEQQTQIVEDSAKHILVVAGAGSGKTLTILGKIKYLVQENICNSEEILCISFTKEASNSLKEKIYKELGIDIDVYTFHKLGLEVLKQYEPFDIADSNTLVNIVHEFFSEDCLYNRENLKIVLKYFKLKNKQEYTKFKDSIYFSKIENLFATFMHLFKSNNHNLQSFIIFLRKSRNILNIKYYFDEKIFLRLALNIYIKYETYLKENKEIDFDDMLIKSTDYVQEYGYKPVKYIIIDEFQDTSLVRFNLIKSILDKTSASLMAVGDDFQSIYRFTGCDLDIFLNFKHYFPDAKILKIENTYRNSQELIEVAGNFVMENKEQIKKNLKSAKKIDKPIKIIYYSNPYTAFENTVNYIYNHIHNKIMIVGRNNKDIYSYLSKRFKINESKITYLKNKDIQLRYLTAHRSKGLEETDTIIINMSNNLLGFPNQIKDERILRFVSNKKSKTPFDEERRLFYVALTRSKNNVYILVPKNNPSVFINELIMNYKSKIEIIKLFPGK